MEMGSKATCGERIGSYEKAKGRRKEKESYERKKG